MVPTMQTALADPTITSREPTAVEPHMLLEAALRLQAAQTGWDNSKGDVDEALRYNRRLWDVFLERIAEREDELPFDVRHNIACLGLFVINQTIAIGADPRPERLSTLIGINRDLAAGLLGAA
jgi:flagellar protein FlaF